MALAAPGMKHRSEFTPHHLHDLNRSWPEINCYVDLWIEVLASYGLSPEAALGFAVTQDFGLDQFTFSKIPLADLELLYGIKVRELSLYRTLEYHTALHIKQGQTVILEADSFYLPDTFATTYHQAHGKTTIAIDMIDIEQHKCQYFHNATRGEILKEDYLGIFRIGLEHNSCPNMMFPYVEVVEQPLDWKASDSLRSTATILLKNHLRRRPPRNPFSAWRELFDQHLDMLMATPELFHDYAFHFPRSAGSNFEMLSDHLEWLDQRRFGQAIAACRCIAQTTKITQYRIARCIARRKVDHADDCFDILEANYLKVMESLEQFL